MLKGLGVIKREKGVASIDWFGVLLTSYLVEYKNGEFLEKTNKRI